MSKVFRDFEKIIYMQKGIMISVIGAGIVIIIAGIIFGLNQESETAKVEDPFDREVQPVENPEIQEKLDNIQKIANETEYTVTQREWITSGPFQIDRSEYAIGEKIFIRLGGIQYDEKGEIAVMRPLNATHYKVYLTIPFDASQKDGFNYYIEPQISKTKGICSIDDLTGKWTLVFRGTNYSSLDFNITEKIVPGTNTGTVC